MIAYRELEFVARLSIKDIQGINAHLKNLLYEREFFDLKEIINLFRSVQAYVEEIVCFDMAQKIRISFYDGKKASYVSELLKVEIAIDAEKDDSFLSFLLTEAGIMKGLSEMVKQNRTINALTFLMHPNYSPKSLYYFMYTTEGGTPYYRLNYVPDNVKNHEKLQNMIFAELGSGILPETSSKSELLEFARDRWGGGTSEKLIFTEGKKLAEFRKCVMTFDNDLGLVPNRMYGILENLLSTYREDDYHEILEMIEEFVTKMDESNAMGGFKNELRIQGRMKLDSLLLYNLTGEGQARKRGGEGTHLIEGLWYEAHSITSQGLNAVEGFYIPKKTAREEMQETGRLFKHGLLNASVAKAIPNISESIKNFEEATAKIGKQMRDFTDSQIMRMAQEATTAGFHEGMLKGIVGDAGDKTSQKKRNKKGGKNM